MPDWLTTLMIVGAMVVLLSVMVVRANRHYRAQQAALKALREQEQALKLFDGGYGLHVTLQTIGGAKPQTIDHPLLCLSPDSISLHENRLPIREVARFPLNQLRWFGRPQKYHDGLNEMWLHWETSQGWQLLQIKLWRGSMTDFVRLLKSVSPEDLVTAYRRRRPYIHCGPERAHPAIQDIHGAWMLEDPLLMYLMPRHLVFLKEDKVLRVIPLTHIEEAGTLKRIDQPNADGLLRFRAEQERLAFALRDAQGFAQQLAEAAKLNLEAPVGPKRKSDDDWEDDDLADLQ